MYYDKLGQLEIPTKIASGLSGDLSDGNNVFYLMVSSLDGVYSNLYELTIHKIHLTTINYWYFDDVAQDDILLKQEYIYTSNIANITFTPDIVGYSFYNWVNDKSDILPMQALQVWHEINLHANLKGNNYRVRLDVNGGDKLMEDVEVTYGQELRLPIPQRKGYVFLGWYHDEEKVSDTYQTTITAWKYSYDLTLTARWRKPTEGELV